MRRIRTRRSYALLCAGVLGLAGCGGGGLAERDASEVEAALVAEGLSICETRTPGAPGEAVEEVVYTVGRTCDEDDDLAVVELVAWPDEAARDAALRRFEVQSRPPGRNAGTTWAFGQYTVAVTGERDDDVVAEVADALDSLGAT